MKSSKKILPLVLAFALLIAIIPAGTALSAVPSAPVMEPFYKSSAAGQEITFDKEDFLSHVTAEANLEGIVISGLPDPAAGVLKFGNRELLTGEAIITDALSGLKFVPAVQGALSAEFSFLPVFGGSVGYEVVTVGLNLSGRENRPPMAENTQLTTYKNIALVKPFPAQDPDGDTLTFKITVKPKRGEVKIMADGSFSYTPYQNKTGNDSFSYVATDAFGNASPEAKVDIKIEKPATKMTYADMDGHPSYYAALKLSEAGVFTGEKVGASHFFNPELTVTRGEFIAMALSVTGLDKVSPVSKTGFADDAMTPAWVKPYASAALKAGIIHGAATPDGRLELRADNMITRAEAVVMLDNALQVADVSAALPVWASDASLPVWALQASVNMEAVGVLTRASDGGMHLTDTLTRGAVAEMLLTAMELHEAKQPKTGLLSWVFG